jgi:predicted dehydrogenase
VNHRPLRIGLIGAGKHGSRYAQHIVADLQDVARLVVLCRRDRAAGETMARAFGCRFAAEIDDVTAAPDVDAVVVVVPPTLNAMICERAAAAGKAILVEKPLAPTVAEAARIRAALDRHGVPFMVAHTLRFNAVVRALRQRIPEIAPLRHVYLSQRFEPSSLEWLDRRAIAGGGIVIHTGVHSFDLLRHFTDTAPESVWCRTWRIDTRETEDNFVAEIVLGGTMHGTVTGSRSTTARNGLIEIAGTGGQLIGDHVHRVAHLLRGRARTSIDVGPEEPTVLAMLRAFVDAVRGGSLPPISWDDGAAAVALAEACYRSAASGAAVPVTGAATGS